METLNKIRDAVLDKRAKLPITTQGRPLFTIILNDKARALLAKEIIRNKTVINYINFKPQTIDGIPYTVDPYQKELFRIVER